MCHRLFLILKMILMSTRLDGKSQFSGKSWLGVSVLILKIKSEKKMFTFLVVSSRLSPPMRRAL